MNWYVSAGVEGGVGGGMIQSHEGPGQTPGAGRHLTEHGGHCTAKCMRQGRRRTQTNDVLHVQRVRTMLITPVSCRHHARKPSTPSSIKRSNRGRRRGFPSIFKSSGGGKGTGGGDGRECTRDFCTSETKCQQVERASLCVGQRTYSGQLAAQTTRALVRRGSSQATGSPGW
jgi:hypothetical protein